jgi:endonuclease YncB( thermonuclease family)
MRLLFLLFFLVGWEQPAQRVATVVRVMDGDTIEILEGKTTTRVRLQGIDAPERGQDFNARSKDYLIQLAAGKAVRVVEGKRDRWKRLVGDVYLADGTHVNAEMVRAGLAWHFVAYDKNPVLAALEVEARRAKRGLWAHPRPMPPWEYRKQKRAKNSR